jgi:hypothetical protein
MSPAREGRNFFLAPPVGGAQLLLPRIADHGGTDCFFHASPTREVHGRFFLTSSQGHNFFLAPPTREGATSSSSRR